MIDQERTQLLFRRLERLSSRTDGAAKPERVHQVRTTARRLEAVLEIVYPKPTTRVSKLLRGLKKLRKRAGAVRDVDVQATALRGLNIGREQERKNRLLAALADARSKREAAFQKTIRSKKTEKLYARLRELGAEIARASAPSDLNGHNWPPMWVDFDPVSASLRMFARLARQTKTLTPDNLHAYRTRCKRIRYVAEMAGKAPEAKRVVSLLKRVQDAIGDWHDWVTLTGAAEELFSRSVGSAMVSALRNMANAKFVEARSAVADVRRELMRDYRAMLALERKQRKTPAEPQPEMEAEVHRKPVTASRAQRLAARIA